MQRICGAGEPLSNSDLVGWAQLGVQHVPRSEDIPIGETHTSIRTTKLNVTSAHSKLPWAHPAALLPDRGASSSE